MALRNDTDIVDMLREGQEEGYRYLFQRHYAPLCAIAYEYVRDDFVAETIVADVFFHVWQIRQRLIVHTSLRNYLAVGVRRRCPARRHPHHAQRRQPHHLFTKLRSQQPQRRPQRRGLL